MNAMTTNWMDSPPLNLMKQGDFGKVELRYMILKRMKPITPKMRQPKIGKVEIEKKDILTRLQTN